MNGKCPGCGRELVCGNDDCKTTEPFFVFMPQLHSIPTDGFEVALRENVENYLPHVWRELARVPPGTPVIIGASVYKYSNTFTPKAPSGRVVRMPFMIFDLWGFSMNEPSSYRERRNSDQKTMKAHLAGKRIQPKWREHDDEVSSAVHEFARRIQQHGQHIEEERVIEITRLLKHGVELAQKERRLSKKEIGWAVQSSFAKEGFILA